MDKVLGRQVLCAAMVAVCCAACKNISPAVVENAARADSWYRYMPRHAPGFCLRTHYAMVWQDEELDLGCWRALHPLAPHRVLMEARGTTFLLHRHYVWDGNTVGSTYPADLLPSLRHDALYHALKEGAPVCRADIDRAYRRDLERLGGGCPPLRYAAIRLFGGMFNRPDPGDPTLILELLDEKTPFSPIEKRKEKGSEAADLPYPTPEI